MQEIRTDLNGSKTPTSQWELAWAERTKVPPHCLTCCQREPDVPNPRLLCIYLPGDRERDGRVKKGGAVTWLGAVRPWDSKQAMMRVRTRIRSCSTGGAGDDGWL